MINVKDIAVWAFFIVIGIPLWIVSEMLLLLGALIGIVKAKLLCAWNDHLVYRNEPARHITDDVKSVTKLFFTIIGDSLSSWI